jgi:hypothetical protein
MGLVGAAFRLGHLRAGHRGFLSRPGTHARFRVRPVIANFVAAWFFCRDAEA